MEGISLLIIDDEANMLHMLKALLSKHGYRIETAQSGEAANDLIREHQFSFILCDVRMPGMSGIEF